jgi:hypothetical protein
VRFIPHVWRWNWIKFLPRFLPSFWPTTPTSSPGQWSEHSLLLPVGCPVGSAVWIRSARSARGRELNQRAAALDSQCISWILQTSLERGVRLSTLKFLAMMPTLVDFTPALVSDCFNILIDCVKVDGWNSGDCTRDGAACRGVCHVFFPHLLSPLNHGSNPELPCRNTPALRKELSIHPRY